MALGLLAPQLKAGALYLDFTTSGGVYATGWTPVYATANNVNYSNVGGSGYNFTFTNVGTWTGGGPNLTRVGFHNQNNYTVPHTFTLSGLTPDKPVRLYACSAWDGTGAGGYIVYGDTGATGVKAQTIGTPGDTTATLANMTLIGTATADGTGAVTGNLWGRNNATATGNAEGQVGGFVFLPTQNITASAGANGSISPDGEADVFAGDSPSYTITANSGYHVADVLVDGASVGAVSSYTFTNVNANHTIAASFAVDTTAYTITASAGSNGSISPVGAVSAFEGTSKPFTITPDTGYHIADVLVDGASVGAVTGYTFTNITANHSIAASFAINSYSITASAGANGTISPAGETVVNHDGSQAFAITPDSGYYVADILVDGVAVAAVPGVVPSSYTISNVTGNHTITANFDNRSRLCLDFAGNGNVTSPDWIPVYANQTADTMVNVANVGGSGFGFSFDHVATWNNGALAPLNQSGFYNFGGAGNSHAFTLTGLIPGQAVSLYACSAWDGNAQGGYVVYGDSGAAGVKAQNIGTPNTTPVLGNMTLIGMAVVDPTGKVTGSLYGSNAVVGSDGNGQVGCFVFAIEAPPVWTITASAGANGSISPSGDVNVSSGQNQAFTITPNSGYHVADVLVDGVTVGAVSSYTFNTVTADHSISATFAANTVTYTITATSTGSGTISPSGGLVLNAGVNQIYTITPDTGSHIVDVLVDGASVGAVGSHSFLNLAAHHTISASFAVNTYTITASAGANGSISPTGPATVNYGDSATYTITPASGYLVDDVQVDGLSVGTPGEYTFTDATANHTISATFDYRTKLKLDFTNSGGAYTANWNPVHAGLEQDTNVDIVNVGRSPYGFTFDHVAAYNNGNSLQSLTRSGFYNVVTVETPHTAARPFALTGLDPGQTVTLHACAAWDGNAAGGYVVFGDSGASGVKVQTVGDPGNTGIQANLTMIGTAIADGTGTVTGSLHGAGGVNSSSEGQVGGFVFAIEPSAPLVDSDNDGMNDAWETTYFGGTGETATGDFDHDGTDNLTEYRLKLVPNNGASLFAASYSDGVLEWPSATGVTFTVEYSATLEAGDWQFLAEVSGTTGTASVSDPPLENARFYRVKLNP